jgi:hypothetical protein
MALPVNERGDQRWMKSASTGNSGVREDMVRGRVNRQVAVTPWIVVAAARLAGLADLSS